jgi:hypothetical protein
VRYFLIGSDCTGRDPKADRHATVTSIWVLWAEPGNLCTGSKCLHHPQAWFDSGPLLCPWLNSAGFFLLNNLIRRLQADARPQSNVSRAR